MGWFDGKGEEVIGTQVENAENALYVLGMVISDSVGIEELSTPIKQLEIARAGTAKFSDKSLAKSAKFLVGKGVLKMVSPAMPILGIADADPAMWQSLQNFFEQMGEPKAAEGGGEDTGGGGGTPAGSGEAPPGSIDQPTDEEFWKKAKARRTADFQYAFVPAGQRHFQRRGGRGADAAAAGKHLVQEGLTWL